MAFKVIMKPNRDGIERLRELSESIILTEHDRKGPLLRELGRTNVKQVRRAIATQGASSGAVWQGWSPGYVAWRAKNALGRTMMVLTGTLKAKFTAVTHGDHIREWVRPFTYRFGARDEIAFRHQTGDGGLPVRSVINKTDADHQEFRNTLFEFYIKRLRQVLVEGGRGGGFVPGRP